MNDGYLQYCTVKRRKARSEHKCCECSGIIRKGETYEFISGLSEGKWETYKICQDCEELRDEYDKDLSVEERAGLGGLFCEIEQCHVKEVREKAVAVLEKRHKIFPTRFKSLRDNQND